jgi:hypothetical protein
VPVADSTRKQNADDLSAAEYQAHRADPSRSSRVRDFFTAGPKRNSELDAEIAARVGKINPAGYRDTYATLIRPPHNPYLMLLNAMVIVGFGVGFFFAMEGKAFWVGFWFGLFLALVGLLLIVVTVRRIPAWHAARRIAANYMAQHGGDFPNELRIWN